MKVTEHIARAKKTLFSFEILPPLRGQGIEGVFNTLDPLMEFNPPFIDVTYHREEFVYIDRGDRLLQKKTISRRPGTVGICAAIMNKYGVDAVPHLLCGGFDKQMTEDALIDLHFLGIDNVLLLRGDPIKSEKTFTAEEAGHNYAVELVGQLSDLNRGKYLDGTFEGGCSSDFCIGVAGYPEKHFESPNMEEDLYHLKRKIEAGADYIVTQMFFDNRKYFEFFDRCRAVGITVPIIPGIKPISTRSQLSALPAYFYVDIPNELVQEVQQAKDQHAVYQVGIEWAIQQSAALKKAGVEVIHYYTMGKPDPIHQVVQAIF
ncbi:MAG: methylenetetrahydrofolate reductase [NAD(P)H] [Flavobacteriales bacterium AspAUS03]